MLTQTRMGYGSLTFQSMGPMTGHYTFHMSKSGFLCVFDFLLLFWVIQLFFFFEMIMLIYKLDILTQTQMEIDSVTFSNMGTMRSQYLLYDKICVCFIFFLLSKL